MKLGVLAIAILACVGLLIILSYLGSEQRGRVCLKSECFNVSLARTPSERSRGLMFVSHLDDGSGMLFVFDGDGDYAFWMKDTLIPLDIIWISSDSKVVFIKSSAQPCTLCDSIDPGKQARYVLEVNAGVSERLGLAVGDSVAIEQ